MGLFDIFKKKNDVSISITKKSTDELKKEYISCLHNPSPAPLNRKQYGIAVEEIHFLEYADGHNADISTFSQKYLYEYDLDYQKTIAFLLANGYLQYGESSDVLKLYNTQELKDFLKKYNLPVTGKKENLIQRIIESNIEYENDFSKKIFVATEKGRKVIDQYKTDYGVPKTEKERHNLLYQKYSFENEEYMKKGEWGRYAMNLYHMSEILRKEGKLSDQLNLLIISAYYDLSGIDNDESYFLGKQYGFDKYKPLVFIPPAIIRNTLSVLEKLNMSIADYEKHFKETVKPSMVRDHIFTVDECSEIMGLYLSGENAQADANIKKGVNKFIKNHSCS